MNGSLFAFKSQIPKGEKENMTTSVIEQDYTPQANYLQKWQLNFIIIHGIGKTGIMN